MAAEDKGKVGFPIGMIDAWKHIHVEAKEGEAQKMPTKDVLLELMEKRAELLGRKTAQRVEGQILGHSMSMVGTDGPNVVFQNSWGGDKPEQFKLGDLTVKPLEPPLLFSVDNLPLPVVHQGFAYGESTTEPPLSEDEEPIIITSVNE